MKKQRPSLVFDRAPSIEIDIDAMIDGAFGEALSQPPNRQPTVAKTASSTEIDVDALIDGAFTDIFDARGSQIRKKPTSASKSHVENARATRDSSIRMSKLHADVRDQSKLPRQSTDPHIGSVVRPTGLPEQLLSRAASVSERARNLSVSRQHSVRKALEQSVKPEEADPQAAPKLSYETFL